MTKRMTEKQAYSWLIQPGIQATLFHYDRDTNAALKVAINALKEKAIDKSDNCEENILSDQKIMFHRFAHKNVKRTIGELAKELGISRKEYEEACSRAMAEEAKLTTETKGSV